MNILIVGSGGREHALAWKIRQSAQTDRLYIAPGNGGTALLGTNVAIADNDIPALVDFAQKQQIDLVVTGPELPLVLGLREAMDKVGIACFGPNSYAAQLEGSKVFAKQTMQAAGVPTAAFAVFSDYPQALTFVRQHPLPLVIKADGLAAGKGVVIAQTLAEAENALQDMMVDQIFGEAGTTVIIEEALVGEEASFLAFCDGTTIVPMPSLQDHKRIGDNDTGPNTGGMGAYAPAPILPADNAEAMTELCIRPIVAHLAAQGHPFTGILYAGLMMTEAGPMVLEYNVRFGDPECQPLMTLLTSDLVEILLACVQGTLKSTPVRFAPKSSCCVVMAAQGYPLTYPRGMRITGIAEAEHTQEGAVAVFQAGTVLQKGEIRSSGGRVLGVTALGNTLAQARDNAYAAVNAIHFDNMYYRKDIAAKGLRRDLCRT